MKKSLEKRIIDYFLAWKQADPEHWINGGEIEKLAQSVGYKASNASRRCRELVNDCILERRENKKGHVEYRYFW